MLEGVDLRNRRVPVTAALFVGAPALAAPSTAPAATGPMLVIEDNDFAGPATSNIQSIVPLLSGPGVRVLGFTVVTGDAWRDEETQFICASWKLPVGRIFPLCRAQSIRW